MKERSNINKDRFDDFGGTNASSQSGSRSISRILQEIVNHVAEIIRSEVRLVRTEVRQDITQVVKAGTLVVVGAVLVLYALGFILLGGAYALATVMPAWLSAVSLGIVVGIVATIFLLAGRTKMKRASLKPDETIQSLQENVTWIKKRTG
jgi:uncharacterized membrane protein YqjE